MTANDCLLTLFSKIALSYLFCFLKLWNPVNWRILDFEFAVQALQQNDTFHESAKADAGPWVVQYNVYTTLYVVGQCSIINSPFLLSPVFSLLQSTQYPHFSSIFRAHRFLCNKLLLLLSLLFFIFRWSSTWSVWVWVTWRISRWKVDSFTFFCYSSPVAGYCIYSEE